MLLQYNFLKIETLEKKKKKFGMHFLVGTGSKISALIVTEKVESVSREQSRYQSFLYWTIESCILDRSRTTRAEIMPTCCVPLWSDDLFGF